MPRRRRRSSRRKAGKAAERRPYMVTVHVAGEGRGRAMLWYEDERSPVEEKPLATLPELATAAQRIPYDAIMRAITTPEDSEGFYVYARGPGWETKVVGTPGEPGQIEYRERSGDDRICVVMNNPPFAPSVLTVHVKPADPRHLADCATRAARTALAAKELLDVYSGTGDRREPLTLNADGLKAEYTAWPLGPSLAIEAESGAPEETVARAVRLVREKLRETPRA